MNMVLQTPALIFVAHCQTVDVEGAFIRLQAGREAWMLLRYLK